MGKTFTPKQQNWKWFQNDAAEPSTQLANENVKPTLADSSIIRLRVTTIETGDANGGADAWSLQYDTDSGFSSPQDFGAAQHWDYADGLATEGNTITGLKTSDAVTQGIYFESGIYTYQLGKSDTVEHDFAVQPTANVSGNTTYYFRVLIAGTPVPLNTGETSPQVLTAESSTTFERNPAESIGLTDSQSVVKSMVREIADNEGLTDEIARAATYIRLLTEIIGITQADSDNFNRADEDPLSDSGKWTQMVGMPDPMKVVSQEAVPKDQDTSGLSGSYRNTTFSPDQYSEATLNDNYDSTLHVRCQTGGSLRNFYYFNHDPSQGTGSYKLGKNVDDVDTSSGYIEHGPVSPGDRFRLAVVGYTLYLYKNGKYIDSWTDSGQSFSSGQPGIGCYSKFTAWDDWVGGDIGIVDAAVSKKATIKIIAESLGVSDAVVYDWQVGATTWERYPADAVGITDALVRTATAVRELADSLGITDEAVRVAIFNRVVADTSDVTDAATRVATFNRAIADTEGMTDSIAFLKSVGRKIADSVGITDDAQRIATFLREPSDSVGITDDSTRKLTYLRAPADTVGLTDDAQRSMQIARSIADNLGITDAITYKQFLLVSRIVFDNVGVTDDATRTFNASRLLADDVSVSDFYASYKQMVRLIDESLGVTDFADRIANALRIIADDEGVTDAVKTSLAVALVTRIVSDSVGLTDDLAERIIQGRVIAESIGVTDYTAVVRAVVRAIADNLSLSDSPALTKSMARIVADTAGVSDVASRFASAFRTLADDVGITDALNATSIVLLQRVIADSVGLTDSAAYTMGFLRNIADSMGISDYDQIYKQVVRSIGEDVGIADDAQRLMAYVRPLAESVGLSDDVVYVNLAFLTKYVYLAENVGVIDGVSARTFLVAWLSIVIAMAAPVIDLTVAPPVITLEVVR